MFGGYLRKRENKTDLGMCKRSSVESCPQQHKERFMVSLLCKEAEMRCQVSRSKWIEAASTAIAAYA